MFTGFLNRTVVGSGMEMKPGYKQTDAGVIPEPGGFGAISRWLRSNATIPPVAWRKMSRIPEGCQRARDGGEMATDCEGLRSLRDRIRFVDANRGYRAAQPPANRWHPSGMIRAARVDGHLKKMGAVWK
jgi:hypothetical protein